MLCLLLVFSLSSCMKQVDTLPVSAEESSSAEETSPEEPISESPVHTEPADESTSSSEPAIIETVQTEPQDGVKQVTFTVAGDNLIHSCIVEQAMRRSPDGTPDFDYAYQYVAPYIPDADISILNQETIVNDVYPLSNYPSFSTPTVLGDYMLDMGFDAFSIANNHVLDKGEGGLFATLDYWDSRPEAVVCGAYRDTEDMNNIRIIESNGVTFALLGYMEHTNGNALPVGSKAELVYLSEIDTIEQQIKHAKEVADVVIVNVHWGVEVTNEVTDQQRSLARKFTDWGADVIVGTQPHTVQTMEYITRDDGSSCFVFYCLGNFISSMENPLGMAGMIGNFTVNYNEESGRTDVTDVKAIPIVGHYGKNYRAITVYPFRMYTRELAKEHGGVERGFSYEMMEKAFKENIPPQYLDMTS